MSTAYTFPFAPTALASGLEKSPDPAPMSATVIPGFKDSPPMTSSIFRGASCARHSATPPASISPATHQIRHAVFRNMGSPLQAAYTNAALDRKPYMAPYSSVRHCYVLQPSFCFLRVGCSPDRSRWCAIGGLHSRGLDSFF